MITAGQDQGGGGQDDPSNKGRRRDQVQQTTRRSKTRSVPRFEITRGQPLALSRKNLGPDLEEGEAQDGGEHDQLHGRRSWLVQGNPLQ